MLGTHHFSQKNIKVLEGLFLFGIPQNVYPTRISAHHDINEKLLTWRKKTIVHSLTPSVTWCDELHNVYLHMCYCIIVYTYSCVIVSLFILTHMLLYHCLYLHMCYCIVVYTYTCVTVSLFILTRVLLYHCLYLLMCYCIVVYTYTCVIVSLFIPTHVLLYHCLYLHMCYCTIVYIYTCVIVSLFILTHV